LATLVRFSSLFGAVVVTEDMLGVSTWQPPGVHVTPERADRSGYGQLPQIMGDAAYQRFGRVLDYLSDVHGKGLPEAYWYLSMLGVAPERCGCGIGRALIEPVMRQADAAGLPMCLETAQPKAATFFGRLGFRPIIETVDPTGGVRFWTYQRDPANRA
jgi:GNAT superfamily N-acetyltransferase